MSVLLDDAPGPAGGLVALDGSSKRSARPCTCQVPGCMNPVLNGRAYYRRYRICVQHTRETEIVIDGVRSRWCQQCARFQPIGDFDANHRTCRVRLARHNATRHARGERGERARQQAQLAAQQQQRQQQHHHKRQQQKQQQRGQQHSPSQGDVHGSSFAACPLPPSPFEFPGTMHAAPAPAQPNLGPSLHLPSAQLQQVGVLPDGTPAYIQVKGDPATLAGGMHGATQAGPLMFTEPLMQAAGPAGGQGAGPRRASSSSAPTTILEYHPASHSLQAHVPAFAHGVVAQQLPDGTVVLLQQHPLQVQLPPQAQARPARLLSVPPEEHLSGELAEAAANGAGRQVHLESHSPKAAAAGQAAGAAGGASRVSASAELHEQPPPRKAVSANASRLQLLAQQLCEHDNEQPGPTSPPALGGQEPGAKVPVVLPDGTTVMASLLPSAGRAGVTSVGTHHQGSDSQLGASEPMQRVTYKELQRQAVAVPAPDCQASFAFSADLAAQALGDAAGAGLAGGDAGSSVAFTFQPTRMWAGSGGPVQVQLATADMGGGMLLDAPQSSGPGSGHRSGPQSRGASGSSEDGARKQQVVGVKRSHAAAMEQRDGSEGSQAAVSAAKVALQHSGSPNGTTNADHSDATQLPLRDAVVGGADTSVVYTTAGDGAVYQLVHPAESPLLPAGGVVYCMPQGGGTYCMELPPQHQGMGMVSVMSEDAQHGPGGEPLSLAGYADMGLGKAGAGGGVVYAPMCVQVMGAGGEGREGAPTMWLNPAGGSQLLAGTQLISPDSVQLLAAPGQSLGDPLQQVLSSAQVLQAPGEGDSLVAGPGGQLRLLSSQQLVTPTSSGMQGANLISPLGSQLLFATNSGPQLLSGLLQTNSTAAAHEEAGVAWA